MGQNIKDLSTRDTARGPKKLPSLYFQYIDNIREEDNLSTQWDKIKLVDLYCP